MASPTSNDFRKDRKQRVSSASCSLYYHTIVSLNGVSTYDSNGYKVSIAGS